jgi:hypothetical protein
MGGFEGTVAFLLSHRENIGTLLFFVREFINCSDFHFPKCQFLDARKSKESERVEINSRSRQNTIEVERYRGNEEISEEKESKRQKEIVQKHKSRKKLTFRNNRETGERVCRIF